MRTFFDQLAASADPSIRTIATDSLNQIESDSGADIATAMPSIVKCLSHPNDEIKMTSALALFAVARRADGRQIMNRYTDWLAYLLALPNERFQSMAELIFITLRPLPVKQMVPSFVAYIKRTDSAARIQPAVAGALVQYVSDQPGVLDAVYEFMRRPADASVRIATMNAVFRPGFHYEPIITAVVSALDDPDSTIRSAAITELSRMGNYAIGMGLHKLRRIAEDVNEPTLVRDTAQDAIKEYGVRQ